MNMKLSKDLNGNKILVASFVHTRGFSVQTNNNLQRTHRMTNDNLNDHIAFDELNSFIKEYGTDRQKELLGW